MEEPMSPVTWDDGSEARRVRVYSSEEDAVGKVPAQHAIVAFLRRHNAAGVTVMSGKEGFGASGRLHASRLTDVPWDLPIIIEWVDTVTRVEELLPQLKQIVPAGMITVDRTEVVLFAHRAIRPVSEVVPVETVMTKDVVTVARDTPVANVVELMRKQTLGAIPVVDGGIVVGIITSSNLVKRARLGVRLSLLSGLTESIQASYLEALPPQTAEQVMTSPVVVATVGAPLSKVAETMVQRRLKRLPVVVERNALVGIVSRLDLLRTVAEFGQRKERGPLTVGLNGDAPIATVMREDIPTVYADSPLGDVVQAVVSTRLDRALVVDAHRHVLGVVTARAVLERVTPALHSHVLRSLMHRLPFLHPSAEELTMERHGRARTAADLMTTEVTRARPDDRLRAVIAVMVDGGQKLVAVVDGDGCLLGVVDRADVLRGVLEPL
jgi:CBS domain-containing protein